jgi:DNA-binding PadR family transcriptional regulator
MRVSAQVCAVLAALRDGHAYGLSIIRHTGLKSGTVYPILARMTRAGWVTARREETPAAPGRVARCMYEVTPEAP